MTTKTNADKELLKVHNLKTYFYLDEGVAKAVDDVSFEINAGQVFGLVGESGCGKSVTALSILRLVQSPPGKIVEGEITFQGQNLLKLSEKEMRSIRGNKISMIFQEPMTSLNPVFTVGHQVAEAIMLHQNMSKPDALYKTIELFETVGIPSPEIRVRDYPHQLSGGMRQRVMIAMAVACNPDLLIADEPTTALDVTIQAEILRLLLNLKKEFDTSVMLITHDLGVIAETADIVAVMYTGKIVEYTTTEELFARPLHPYTIGLFRSIPRIDEHRTTLATIEGVVPSTVAIPPGCSFHPRCPLAIDKCKEIIPPLEEIVPGHKVACIRARETLNEY